MAAVYLFPERQTRIVIHAVPITARVSIATCVTNIRELAGGLFYRDREFELIEDIELAIFAFIVMSLSAWAIITPLACRDPVEAGG